MLVYDLMKKIYISIFEFLKELNINNKREWFDENRNRYKIIRKQLVEFTEELILMMAPFDSALIDNEVKPYIFRINRDTRFSKNKKT